MHYMKGSLVRMVCINVLVRMRGGGCSNRGLRSLYAGAGGSSFVGLYSVYIY